MHLRSLYYYVERMRMVYCMVYCMVPMVVTTLDIPYWTFSILEDLLM
jgi:hypothetical protein